MGGISRFEDFHAHLGLSRKTLSAPRVARRPRGHDESAVSGPPNPNDYRLTPKGDALTPALSP
jgi:hypothetical protein